MKLTEAQIARLHSLTNDRGELRPDDVVADAKFESSPLHALFEWDLEKAAHAHRLDRAREVIGSVTYLTQTTTHTVRSAGYVRDPDAPHGEQGYRHVTALRADPVAARQSLIYTLTVAEGHLRRAQDLSVALGLTAEIDELLAQVAGVKRLIETAA